jgi:hypothetical protein
VTRAPKGAVKQDFASGSVSRNFGADGDHDSLQQMDIGKWVR